MINCQHVSLLELCRELGLCLKKRIIRLCSHYSELEKNLIGQAGLSALACSNVVGTIQLNEWLNFVEKVGILKSKHYTELL